MQQQQNNSRNLFASIHVVAQLWWTRESKLSPQLSQENWDEGKFSSIGAELCHCIIVHQVNKLMIGSSWSHREGDPSFLEGRWSSWPLIAPTPTCQIPQHRYKRRYKYRHKYMHYKWHMFESPTWCYKAHTVLYIDTPEAYSLMLQILNFLQ